MPSVMNESSTEATPLLADEDHPHTALFDELDAEHDKNHAHDQPACPYHRAVKRHLTYATLPAGCGHPIHHHLQSPALILRLQQSIEHGFGKVFHAVRSFFKTKHLEAVYLATDPTYHTVVAVFIIAILTMLSMAALGPTLLLFMNHTGFTTPTDISPYVIATAIASAVPIVSNIGLGFIASRVGPGHALSVGAALSAFGLLVVIFSESSVIIFFIGYGIYSIVNSLRVVRVSILSKVVPENERTTVLATHALMTPLGALMGPVVWIVAQTYRGTVPTLSGLLEINRFTLTYAVVCAVLLSISATASFTLADIAPDRSAAPSTAHSENAGQTDHEGAQDVTLHYSSGGEEVVNLHQYRTRVFRYFCGIMFGVNLSAGLFMTSFQPILVNVFRTSDSKLGVIFMVVAVFAVLPPLLVALLSRYLMDRQILLIGLTSKLIGMMLYLPMFGAVREWQVIAGFILIIKASIFFSTASMSLFTKVLGPMSTSSLLGVLASASNIGPAVAQIALADHIVSWFGSFEYAAFAIPAILSFAFILYPKYWKRLNPGREFTRLLMIEAQRKNSS